MMILWTRVRWIKVYEMAVDSRKDFKDNDIQISNEEVMDFTNLFINYAIRNAAPDDKELTETHETFER